LSSCGRPALLTPYAANSAVIIPLDPACGVRAACFSSDGNQHSQAIPLRFLFQRSARGVGGLKGCAYPVHAENMLHGAVGSRVTQHNSATTDPHP
jgi:hypothetical protein